MRKPLIILCLTLAITALLTAQRDDWTRPFPGHRVVGNLYHVGTYDLACFLITTSDGNILINTGIDSSTPILRANIESLSFRLEDVKILLTMQAHWEPYRRSRRDQEDQRRQDVGDRRRRPDSRRRRYERSALRRQSQLRAGEGRPPHPRRRSDRAGRDQPDGRLNPGAHDGQRQLHHEGPKKAGGTTTWSSRTWGQSTQEKDLSTSPTYPGVAEDFAETFRKQKALKCDHYCPVKSRIESAG